MRTNLWDTHVHCAEIVKRLASSRGLNLPSDIMYVYDVLQKQYSGYRADLLQLCAIRYYSMPSIIRRNVRFGYTFQSYIRSQVGSKQSDATILCINVPLLYLCLTVHFAF